MLTFAFAFGTFERWLQNFSLFSNRFKILKFRTCRWQKLKKSISQLPKHTMLLLHGICYGRKIFYGTSPHFLTSPLATLELYDWSPQRWTTRWATTKIDELKPQLENVWVEIHKDLWISCELLMNFLWTSYKFLTNFLWISCKRLTNFS